MPEDERLTKLIEDAKKQGSLLARSPEHIRLEHVGKLTEGPRTLQRPTAGQIEVEAAYHALGALGVNMKGTNHYIDEHAAMSPGADGRGIDGIVKVLTPTPSTAIIGSASEQDKGPGAIERFLGFMLGRKQGGET